MTEDSNIDIDYDDEYDELLRLQAQAAQDIGPLLKAQELPKPFFCTLALRVHGLSLDQREALRSKAEELISETLGSQLTGYDVHAGELSIHCITSNVDELIEHIKVDKEIMGIFLSLNWLNTVTKESKKLWSI